MQHEPNWRSARSKPSKGWRRSTSRRNYLYLPLCSLCMTCPQLSATERTLNLTELSWIADLVHSPHPCVFLARHPCLQQMFTENPLGAKHCVWLYDEESEISSSALWTRALGGSDIDRYAQYMWLPQEWGKNWFVVGIFEKSLFYLNWLKNNLRSFSGELYKMRRESLGGIGGGEHSRQRFWVWLLGIREIRL